jgi:SAM-dependent methyltransferase
VTTLVGREDRLTFRANAGATRYGWLRLTPAYSVHLVAGLLDRHASDGTLVLDPYCGTGTTALVCAERGIACRTTDINPFLIWLTRAKTARYEPGDIAAFATAAARVGAAIRTHDAGPEWLPALHRIDKWWDEPTLRALGRATAAIRAQDVPPRAADLLRLALCRVLIARASVSFGHQSMSFKRRVAGEARLPPERLVALAADAWAGAVRALERSAATPIRATPRAIEADARALTAALAGERAGCVITSPPYPNRMSYVRELRPYMYWLGYLADGRAAGELDWRAIGGTWGCATSNVGKWAPPAPRPLPYDGFDAIVERIAAHSDLLSRYVHKYFHDIDDHVAELVAVLEPGATVHYIVGNSKFYDVLVPVERIYAALFERHGLADVNVEPIRKRSSKRELFEYVVSARHASAPAAAAMIAPRRPAVCGASEE